MAPLREKKHLIEMADNDAFWIKVEGNFDREMEFKKNVKKLFCMFFSCVEPRKNTRNLFSILKSRALNIINILWSFCYRQCKPRVCTHFKWENSIWSNWKFIRHFKHVAGFLFGFLSCFCNLDKLNKNDNEMNNGEVKRTRKILLAPRTIVRHARRAAAAAPPNSKWHATERRKKNSSKNKWKCISRTLPNGNTWKNLLFFLFRL